jgi:hypothetical protein
MVGALFIGMYSDEAPWPVEICFFLFFETSQDLVCKMGNFILYTANLGRGPLAKLQIF